MLSIATYAQTGSPVKLPTVVGDTIKNTGTVAKVIKISGGYSGAAVQVVLTKVSGTGAGTVQLQSSNDGVNYVNVGSAFTITDVATQSTLINASAPLPGYLKVLCTGSGTEAVGVAVWYRVPLYQHN